MRAPDERLLPNSAEVVSKVMDGEAIIIRLSDGIYYSLDKVGGTVWELIERCANLDEIVAAVTAGYEVDEARARADVERLTAELRDERLLVVATEGGAGPAEPAAAGAKQPYEPPQLNVYRDMGDLLALDPPAPTLKDLPWKKPSDEPLT